MGGARRLAYPHARGDQPAELALSHQLGVDGLFADNADTAVAYARRPLGARRRAGNDPPRRRSRSGPSGPS
jgi:glycerophosphoryl diester phosphodiesterase